MARNRDPRTKEELLDRMMSFDFDGDIRHLGVEAASIVRVSPNTLRLSFPASGTVFELSVHRPREFSQAARAAGEGRSFSRAADELPAGLRRVREPEVAEEPQEAPRTRKRRKDAGQPRRQPEQRTG
jgi:hypothetical protein